MYQYQGLEDTIAAVATASGPGGIGVIRLSGSESVATVGSVFVAKSGRSLESVASHTIHYGWVRDKGVMIDEVLVSVMLAPRTYTRQDVVEISCHGGAVSVRAVLELVLKNGARLAEPGEFTKRAFLNGRIDLTQAEAVLDIIGSRTDVFLRASVHQLKGELADKLEATRDEILEVYTALEAVMNFPDDDRDAHQAGALAQGLEYPLTTINALLATADQGRIVKEGVRVALCGKPNVGKSSLLNALLRVPRAIVSDVAGTTRDTIEETAQIGGVPLQLIDTAGIIAPRDGIEEDAVRRSRAHMDSADLVLFVVDGSQELTDEDLAIARQLADREVLVVINKMDLPSRVDEAGIKQLECPDDGVRVSALCHTDLDFLRERILQRILPATPEDSGGVLLSNLRHIEALRRCVGFMSEAIALLDSNSALEVISEEIKSAINELDRITGRNIDADLIDRIFSAFCIGK